MFEAIAPTLAYDAAIIGEDRSVPTKKATEVAVPTLVMNGDVDRGFTPQFMEDTAIALAKAIHNAQHLTLKGQTHAASPEALASVLATFFKA
jgi:pimeloyl-ACP methyl ester carboxylesterase